MKVYTCLECGADGCKLEVGNEASTKPVACPYGYARIETRWTEELP